jgi:hypothetical protein
MSAFPDAVAPRIEAEADAVAQIPDAHHVAGGPARQGDSRSQGLGIVDDRHRHLESLGFQRGAQQILDAQSLELSQVGRIVDDAVADDAGKAGAHAVHRSALAQGIDLLQDPGDDCVRRHGLQVDGPLSRLRIHARGGQAGALHDPHPDIVCRQDTDRAAHL